MSEFILKPLPYAADALQAVMSARTVQIHHGKHQGGYVTRLNDLMQSRPHLHGTLEELIVHTHDMHSERAVFNNAAQLWNHEFYWESLSPNSTVNPPASLTEHLVRAFGSVASFREQVVRTAAEHFGSGWVWLTASSDGRWRVMATHDAHNPLPAGEHALWVCDLWEHAYYLDWQQDRAGFVRSVVDRLINWQQVARRVERLREQRHVA